MRVGFRVRAFESPTEVVIVDRETVSDGDVSFNGTNSPNVLLNEKEKVVCKDDKDEKDMEYTKDNEEELDADVVDNHVIVSSPSSESLKKLDTNEPENAFETTNGSDEEKDDSTSIAKKKSKDDSSAKTTVRRSTRTPKLVKKNKVEEKDDKKDDKELKKLMKKTTLQLNSLCKRYGITYKNKKVTCPLLLEKMNV